MSAERATYTVAEVAEILGVSTSTAYESINRGEIPHLRLGNRIVIPKAGIDSLLSGETPDHQGDEERAGKLRAV